MAVARPRRAVAPPLGRSVVPEAKLLRTAYLADGETMLRETRATGLFYFPGPIVVLLILGLLDVSAYGSQQGWSPGVPGLTGAFDWVKGMSTTAGSYVFLFFLFVTLLAFLWLLIRYLRWISTVYAVTTTRVIVQSGIFSRDFDEIPIQQIRGVDVHQTFGQRLLGYGTMWVSSEGGMSKIGNEAWYGIPKPFEFQRLVENATRRPPANPPGP